MLIKRSFGVLRFLNRRHVWPIRALAAITGGLIALICTQRLALVRELMGQFMSGSFKLAGRRVGFYLRAGWPQANIAFDPFFNFTEGLSPAQLEVLEAWVTSRKSRLPQGDYAGHMLLVYAARAHGALEAGNRDGFEAQLGGVQAHANMLLGSIKPVEHADIPEGDTGADTPGFAEHAGQVLQDFERDLPIDQWDWFVIGGTFLGMVRDKGFLPHDEDLDVGLFLDGLDLEGVRAAFANSPYFTVAKFDTQAEIVRDGAGQASLRYMPAMLKLVHSNGINLDVFLHERREGKIWHGSGVHMWVNDPFTLSEYELEGQKVLGPDSADHYLREHYGEWRVVVKDFSCTTGTTNLAFVKNLYTIAVLLKRYAHFTTANPKEADKILRELMQQGYIRATDGRAELVSGFV